MRFKIDSLLLEANKKGKKVTQSGLATAAKVGQTAIHKIVHNRTKAPKPEILYAIADTFTEALGRKVTIDDLIEQNGKPPAVPIQNVVMESDESVNYADYVWLPIYGEIPDGELKQVGEGQIVDRLPLPKRLVGPARFALRASGDSMYPKILDRDLLLIEPGNRWGNNDIVIAWVNGEVTCKRLQINHSHALLIPENREYQTVLVMEDIRIIGRVIGKYEVFIKGWMP
jgi:SOS-response transcriptional repressor LexA